MSPFSHIRFAGKSDVGRRRKNNEDSFGMFPACGVFCVADGMGGGDDGEIASAATVNAVREFCAKHPFPSGKCWKTEALLDGVCGSVVSASNWIFNRAQGKGLKGCGSTFVGLCLDLSRPDMATALHAGDSRLYLLHRGLLGGETLRQITRDHSVAEMIGAKDERSVKPAFRGMIIRAVGVLPTVEIERTSFRLSPGDRILLCSDGITKMLSDRRIAAIMKQHDSPSDVVDSLITEANAVGGVDNATALVVRVDSIPEPLMALDLMAMEPLARDEEGDSDDEPVTDDTGYGAVGTADDDGDEMATLTMGVTTPAMREKARHGFDWHPVLVAVGIVVVLALVGGTACLLLRRAEAMKFEDAVRDERMNQAVENVKRQTEWKNRQRLESERILRDADDLEAKEKREEELKQIERNVDLPRE